MPSIKTRAKHGRGEKGFQTWNIACRPAISIYDKPRYRYFIEKKGRERESNPQKNKKSRKKNPRRPLQLIWNVFEKMLKYEIWPFVQLISIELLIRCLGMLGLGCQLARERSIVGEGHFEWQRIGFPHSESASVRRSTHRSRPHWPKAPWRHPTRHSELPTNGGEAASNRNFLVLNSPVRSIRY